MNENKRMTSIARRINTSFWLKRFFDLLGFNLILLMLIVVTFGYWRYEQVPEAEHVTDMYFDAETGYDDLQFFIQTEEGNLYSYYVHEVADYLIVPGLVLVSFELIHLFFALLLIFLIQELKKVPILMNIKNLS